MQDSHVQKTTPEASGSGGRLGMEVGLSAKILPLPPPFTKERVLGSRNTGVRSGGSPLLFVKGKGRGLGFSSRTQAFGKTRVPLKRLEEDIGFQIFLGC